ncbi:Aerobic respiration control sensor protein arcB [Pyrenophora teres f. maculata]|nr:Aerobic respiration control sensor protein arcB [Pyrenophora teres f. maculata]
MGNSFLGLPSPPPSTSETHEAQRKEAALEILHTSSLAQLLDQDNRPTFVLNMDDYAKGSGVPIQPIFYNTALMEQEQLLCKITKAPADDPNSRSGGATHEEFRIWATVISRFSDSRDIFPITIEYQDFLWLGICIHPKWRIISAHAIFYNKDIPQGDPLSASAPRLEREGHGELTDDMKKALASAEAIPTHEIIKDVQQPKFPPVSLGLSLGQGSKNARSYSISSVTLSTPDSTVPDWTVPHPRGVLSEHLQFVRSIDWAKTPLGAMKRWSIQFREIVCLVMRNPHPSSVFWGEDLTMLYNEAYRDDVTGDKHPALMGTGFSGPFGEMWHAVGPIIRECARTGHAQLTHNQPLPIMRYGYMEESFFTWSFVPVFGGTDRVLGFYLNAFDTTIESISSRRMELLRYLGECMNATRTVKEFWERVLDGLNHNEYDVPFALLYSIADSEDPDTVDSPSSDVSTFPNKFCILEGTIGVLRGHSACPEKFNLRESYDTLTSAFSESTRTLEPKMLCATQGSLPETLLDAVQWRGYEDPSREAMILPLRPTNADNTCALLLLGINPRRAYDQEYRTFLEMLNRQIATSLASVLLFEDEVRRSKHEVELATLQKEQLSQQLQLQTTRMRRMTELSPLGMFLFEPGGRLLEANDRYYEMTGVSPKEAEEPWSVEMMVGDSQRVSQEMWDYMVNEHRPASRELQFANSRVQPKDIDGQPIEYWVLVNSQPEIDADGELVSIMGSITDISHLKWAQGLQERRLREAEESKRQQNEFIDITSHEMRNPLSAILICADDIRDTMTKHCFSNEYDRIMAKDCIEAANNIALCVHHQKSIVDDILTVSKLDSNLLRITPIPSQPILVVQRSMAMFRPEAHAKRIGFKFDPHPSLHKLNIDWVLLDPGRLLQIIVNLITNALKFTQDSPNRLITVQVSAHEDQPKPDTSRGFDFVPPRNNMTDMTSGECWGSGSLVYLQFQVQDTGCGLSSQQKTMLFEKFAQASPRSHVQYGGSGLGLFISRQLAELHGGQIGCSSEAGVGSTFGFYLECKRIIPQRPTLPRRRNSYEPEKNLTFCESIAAAASKIDEKLVNVALTQRIEDSKELQELQEPKATPSPQAPKNLEVPRSPKDPPNEACLHVLVVEDNLVNQKVLCKQLTKAGCNVSTADNGVWALKHLEKTNLRVDTNGIPLSIILIDCEMPEMDGLTCCRKIREMEQNGKLTKHVPVIAVTANIRGGQIDTAKEAGMDEVIGKPFRIPDLLAKMKGLLERLGN